MQTLWGNYTRRRRKRRSRKLATPAAYSITIEGNDCEIIGHTLNSWDLAGCTTCMDCGVRIFCPACTTHHPLDENAIPVFCPHHESQVQHAE